MMKLHSPELLRRIRSILLTGVLGIPILMYVAAQCSRPPRIHETRSLFPGVTYEREAKSLPRPVMLHIVTIDLSTPGIKPFVTPSNAAPLANAEVRARTVSEFLNEFQVQLAVNANFFYPFREEAPWDFYPHDGDWVNNSGQVISKGEAYSPPQPNWATMCFLSGQRAQMYDSGTCPAGTVQAVAGKEILVQQGKPTSFSPDALKNDKPYPRTAIAIDKTGQKLWLILVDGKQFRYSEGLTVSELATYIATELKADAAINLDGGGSVTLAVQTLTGAQVLNAPIQTRLPMHERPVASHLGFYLPTR
jgi:hypothetical protein